MQIIFWVVLGIVVLNLLEWAIKTRKEVLTFDRFTFERMTKQAEKSAKEVSKHRHV